MSSFHRNRLTVPSAFILVAVFASAPWSSADPCAPQPPTTYPVGNAEIIEFEVCDRGKMSAVGSDGERFTVVYERPHGAPGPHSMPPEDEAAAWDEFFAWLDAQDFTGLPGTDPSVVPGLKQWQRGYRIQRKLAELGLAP